MPAAATRACPWRSISSVRSTPTTLAPLRAASWSATPAVPEATSRTTPSAGSTQLSIAARHRPFWPKERSSARRSYLAGNGANRSRAKRLGRGEELGHQVGGQVAQQADVQLGHEQRMAAEQRPVVEERDQPFCLKDDHGFLVAADDGAEDTRCWHQA